MQDDFRANLPRRKSFMYRHPRAFILIGITISMFVMFSKPIYDITYATPEQRSQQINREKFGLKIKKNGNSEES